MDLYPGHALPEVGNVGTHRANVVPNFRDIASHDPISELNVLRTDSISALEDMRIESCCSTISVAIAIVDAVTVPTTDPTIANVCCRTVFTVPTFGTMVTQHRLGITADSGGFRQK